MQILLVLVLILWMALPIAVAVTPPVVALVHRRLTVPAVLLYAVALALVVAFVVASNAHMEWADRTGGQGSIFAGGTWLVAAVLAASACVRQTVRGRRRDVAAG